tara:strand:+ start:402 stop:1886 length:1485 start_codon:yes stop_codon:yes gene_type:complete
MFNEIFKHSRSFPNKTAIINDNKKCSYFELISLVNNLKYKLSFLKLKENNIIAIENKNFFHFIAGSIALIRQGIICLPLTGDKDLSVYLIKESNARYILRSTGDDYKSKFYFEELKEYNYRKKFPKFIPLKKNNKPAILYPTSGTSGKKRKIVVQGKKALNSTMKYISEFMKLNSNLIEFIGSPPDNVFWFGRIRCCLGVGGTIVLNHNPTNPIVALNEIKKNNCNAITADTSFHLMMIKYFKKRLLSLSNQIKWIKLSSQPVPLDKLKDLMNLFPKAKIIMGYGLTEAMRTTLIDYRKNLKRLNSVGTPQKGVKIKLYNDKKKNKNRDDIEEITIKGENLALGYLNSKLETKKKFKNNVFHTGDCGKIDNKGFLYFKSRADSIINIGGVSHSSEEILSVIKKKIDKCSSIIVGIDGIDDILGSVPILLLEKNIYSKNFFENLMKKKYKFNLQIMPRAIYDLSMFPKTKNGKILLSKLPKNLLDLKKLNKVWSV